MTIRVLVTGHQICCILWEQKAIFNKGIGFLYGLNYLYWLCFVKNTYNRAYVLVRKYPPKDSIKDLWINNNELLNIQACSFQVVLKRVCTQSLVVSCKCWVDPLVFTRISGYSQVILLAQLGHLQSTFSSKAFISTMHMSVRKIWLNPL